MSATTTYLPDPGIIEIRFTGATSGNDLARSTIEGIGLAREHRTRRVLVDTTGMTLTASLVDVVKLPTDQYVAEHVDTRTRIALVCPPGARAGSRAVLRGLLRHPWFRRAHVPGSGERVGVAGSRECALPLDGPANGAIAFVRPTLGEGAVPCEVRWP